ncbi:MAG: hypothetical protein KDC92_17935, partial [Bacteroidetes bacterium]|nr:hypothetical protein [Bacteroidota bacterium]
MSRSLYYSAFSDYVDMLSDKSTLDFKKAVFMYENAYHADTLEFSSFSEHFAQLAEELKSFIKFKGIGK